MTTTKSSSPSKARKSRPLPKTLSYRGARYLATIPAPLAKALIIARNRIKAKPKSYNGDEPRAKEPAKCVLAHAAAVLGLGSADGVQGRYPSLKDGLDHIWYWTASNDKDWRGAIRETNHFLRTGLGRATVRPERESRPPRVTPPSGFEGW